MPEYRTVLFDMTLDTTKTRVDIPIIMIIIALLNMP